MTKNLNIILGNAPINNGNRGCVALSYTSMYLIDKVLSEANLAYKLYLPDASYPTDGVYTIDIAGKQMEYEQIPYTVAISNKDRLKKLVKYKKSCRAHGIFRNADYILDIGQGDSFADIYGKVRFDLINKIHREALKFHKPYCLLPQTIGPFKDPAIKAQAVKAIAGADMVMARDKQSYDYVINNVPQQKNVKEYIDVAFFLPYKQMTFDKNFIHTFADSNNGGSWRVTNPRAEIKAFKDKDDECNKNLYSLCRMARAWKYNHAVNLKSCIMDILAYRFLGDYIYKDKSYLYYDYMLRDFFRYLSSVDTSKSSWRMPGSNQCYSNYLNFQYKAKQAYNACVEAIDADSQKHDWTASQKWRSIFGYDFPIL